LLGALFVLQNERDSDEARGDVFPTIFPGLPDCLRPHVPSQFNDATCSLERNVTREVLAFLIRQSDFRDTLPKREQIEDMIKDVPLSEDQRRAIKTILDVTFKPAIHPPGSASDGGGRASPVSVVPDGGRRERR
jgi:hypothetical protein